MSKIKGNSNKKQAIITTAAALFRQQGFKATSVRALADALQIEAPSLYNHIGSKAEMLNDICFSVASDYTKTINDVTKTSLSVIEKITKLIHFHIEALYSNYDKVYVADHDWKQLPKKELEAFVELRKSYEQKFIKIVEEGIQKNEIGSGDATIMVLTILSAVRSIVFLRRRNTGIALAVLQKEITQQLLNGIKK
jgi:TetR/AcrR family transcriptional regulator, cholesterol catabolism regulator